MGLLSAFQQSGEKPPTAPTQTAAPQQKGQGGLLSAFQGGAQPAGAATPPPFMALDTDKYGQPYYGAGLRGFTRKVFARIFDPAKLVERPTEEQATIIEQGISRQ